MMHRVYRKFETPRRRHLSERQIKILEFLLDQERGMAEFGKLLLVVAPFYRGLKKGVQATFRDLVDLENLKALSFDEGNGEFHVNLDWPQFMTDSEFGRKILEKPAASKISKFKLR
jgi:hypothetical protein